MARDISYWKQKTVPQALLERNTNYDGNILSRIEEYRLESQVQLNIPGEVDGEQLSPASIVGGEQQIDYVHGSLGMVPMNE